MMDKAVTVHHADGLGATIQAHKPSRQGPRAARRQAHLGHQGSGEVAATCRSAESDARSREGSRWVSVKIPAKSGGRRRAGPQRRGRTLGADVSLCATEVGTLAP